MGTVAKYNSKLVTIEAARWDGSHNSIHRICRWANDGKPENVITYLTGVAEDGVTVRVFDVQIATPEGIMTASPGDYIVHGLMDEFYPCKPEVFHAKYELKPVTI